MTLDGSAAGTTADMPALTALRALAALLVFVYHFPPREPGPVLGTVISQGHVGVTVFFVLSGFLITLRYYPRFARGERGIADYFVRRAARILPLYFFVLTLSLLLDTGRVPVDLAHLPDWTLTGALFGASTEDITIPTAWSLTVEECFYASAPLVFLALARLRSVLGAAAGSLLGLLGAVATLHVAGSLLLALPTPGLAFLTDELLLRSYTVFGRFPDFACGAGAGLLFLSGRVEAVWRRRRGPLLASALALGAAALLLAGQAGMARSTAAPAAEWRFNLVVVAASALLVLALTCGSAPLSRLLALPLPVYLGRTSYALYLVQLTPLGNGLLYRLLPGDDGVHLLALYAGMCGISALLFELVEEPCRETILGVWRERSLRVLPRAQGGLARALSLAILLVGLLLQQAAWAMEALPPVELPHVEEVLAADSPDLLAQRISADPDGVARVRLPDDWRLGPAGDRRAPGSLLVFVDGQPVPFLGTRPPDGPGVVAYHRRPRATHLSLPLEAPARVTVVNHSPPVAASLAWARLRENPWPVAAPLPLLALAGLVAWRRARLVAPREMLALAVALLLGWLICGLHLLPWGPLALGVEIFLLSWLLGLSGSPGSG